MSENIAKRIIIAGGGYRSGSTVQYNLMGIYLELIGIGRRCGYIEPDHAESFLHDIGHDCSEVLLLKCHQFVAGFRPFKNPEAWAVLVASKRAEVMTTSRDEQEVRRSMCRKFGIDTQELEGSIWWRENEANRARLKQLGAFQQDYRKLCCEPLKAVEDFSRWQSLPFDEENAHIASLQSSRGEAKKICEGLPVGMIDPVSLLHWDHISCDGSWE